MTRSLLLVATTLGLLAAPCRAQTETPEQVAMRITGAMSAGEWGRAAGLLHPVALHQLRELLDPVLSLDGEEADAARQQLFGVPSKATALAASDSALFEGMLRFTMSQRAGLSDVMRTAQYHVIGSVAEGRDTVHVVGRCR